jgi:GT2 family glycosyltransferase
MKTFAIIIVNYNCAKDTIETIESLNKHNKSLFDIFVVDNNSQEDDLHYLKANLDDDVKLIKSKANLGFAGGNNLAIRKVLSQNYKYIFLLNPDTIIDDLNFFPIILEQIKTNNPDILGPMIRYYPDTDKIYFAGGFVNTFTGLTVMKDKKKNYKEYDNSSSFECDFITGCAMIIKKDLIESIGSLPEEYFLYFEESDFCMKAKRLGYKVLFTPKTYVYHKVSTSIKYMSNTYVYYMVRNFRIFANKYVKIYYIPIFYLYYIFVWVGGYIFLSILNKNFKSIKYILKGFLNYKYE